MNDWVSFRDRPRPANPRAHYHEPIRPNRMEQIAQAVARDPGHPAPWYAAQGGMQEQYTYRTLNELAARGFVAAVIRVTTLHGDRRERRCWYPTALMRDVLEGRDHPGTVLGTIRAVVADRPQPLEVIQQAVALPLETVRTLLRLLVLAGDLQRTRTYRWDVYGLVPLEDEREDEEAAA